MIVVLTVHEPAEGGLQLQVRVPDPFENEVAVAIVTA
jgi:hypothetical protein